MRREVAKMRQEGVWLCRMARALVVALRLFRGVRMQGRVVADISSSRLWHLMVASTLRSLELSHFAKDRTLTLSEVGESFALAEEVEAMRGECYRRNLTSMPADVLSECQIVLRGGSFYARSNEITGSTASRKNRCEDSTTDHDGSV